jgi:hypothetical protein
MKWFQHDANAIHDAKIRRLILKYGANGYAVYFHSLELIASNIDKNNITFQLEHGFDMIAVDLQLETDYVVKVIEYILQLGLFQTDKEGKIYCYKLAERLDNTISKNPEINKLKEQIKKNYEATTKLLRNDFSQNRIEYNRIEEKRIDENRCETSSEKDETKPPCNIPELIANKTIKKGSKEYMWCMGSKEYEGICTHKCPQDKSVCVEWRKRHTKEVDDYFKKECKITGEKISNWSNFRKSEKYHSKWFWTLNYQITHPDSWLNSEIKNHRGGK